MIAAVDFVLSLIFFVLTFWFCRQKCGMRIRVRSFEKAIVIDSLPMCLAMLLQSVIQQANNSVDKVIIGARLSVESVAIYSVAQQIYYIFVSIMIAPVNMYLPQIARDLTRKLDRKAFTETLIQPTRLLVLITGVILFGFIAVGKQFIILLYGAEKEKAWLYALILVIPLFVSMTNGVVINILDITKKRLAYSIILFFVAAFNVVLTLMWIPSYGIVGAVLATAVTMILGQVVLLNIYYRISLNIDVCRMYWEAYKAIIPTLCVCALVGYFISGLFDYALAGMLVGGITYMIIALPLLYKFCLNDGEKQIIKRVLKKHIEGNDGGRS